MKTKLFFSIFSFLIVSASFAQTTTDLSLGAGYANQVYYKLSSETPTSFDKNIWDIAFLRISNHNQAIRVNDGIGIEVFEAANSASEWANIDIANEANWTKLYNSVTDRANGAFMQGSATYGWGEYNSTTHRVTGTIIFVLKYADGSYKKFICEEYYGGYTIKYASWNGTSWEADESAVILNTSNPTNNYNYYSLQNNQEVVAEPASSDWDFVFTKYFTELSGGTMYNVTGVLQSDAITVAKSTGDDTSNLTYSTNINTIGYDWKEYTGAWTVDSDKKFYLKYSDDTNTIYKLHFTQFGGSATGDVEFEFENVTQALNIENVGEEVSFGVYPNPIGVDRKMTIVFDNNKTMENHSDIEIYNIAGQRVLKTQVTNSQGFYNKEIDLSLLKSGIYLLQFTSGKYVKTKKLVLK